MATGGVCPHCGRPYAPGATFCSNCGMGLVAAGSVLPPPPPGVPGAPLPPPPLGYAAAGPAYPGPPPPGGPTPATAEADRRALGWIRWTAVIALAGVVLSFADFAVFNPTRLVHTTMTATTTTVTFDLPRAVYLVVTVGVALSFAEYALLRMSFTGLASVDPRFRTPATCALLALIGIPLAGVGAVFLVHGLAGATCTQSTTLGAAGCTWGAGFGLGVALAGVGGLLAFVGFVGALLGLWRLGDRYRVTGYHLATILTIFPILDLVGWILILTSTGEALRRGSGPPGPPGAR